MNINISKLEFEERVDSTILGEVTLYFIGPKELIADKYPEAESATILVNFLADEPHAFYPNIMFSPTKDGKDYDWDDLYIENYEIVKELIRIGLERTG